MKKGMKKWVGVLFFAVCVGVFLFISSANTAKAGTEMRYKYYTSIQIDSGMSLWEIAEEYMTEEYDSQEEYIREVKNINHLKDDLLYAGSYLCVPYYSSEYK